MPLLRPSCGESALSRAALNPFVCMEILDTAVPYTKHDIYSTAVVATANGVGTNVFYTGLLRDATTVERLAEPGNQNSNFAYCHLFDC